MRRPAPSPGPLSRLAAPRRVHETKSQPCIFIMQSLQYAPKRKEQDEQWWLRVQVWRNIFAPHFQCRSDARLSRASELSPACIQSGVVTKQPPASLNCARGSRTTTERHGRSRSALPPCLAKKKKQIKHHPGVLVVNQPERCRASVLLIFPTNRVFCVFFWGVFFVVFFSPALVYRACALPTHKVHAMAGATKSSTHRKFHHSHRTQCVPGAELE